MAMMGPPARAPPDRRLHRRHALLHVPVDVLDHDDGVVDHQPDRQHQRQQGQQIDREAQRQHDGEACRSSDSGIATTGISTERGEPRKAKITTCHDDQRLDQVLATSR
jgi:hypothetical protein